MRALSWRSICLWFVLLNAVCFALANQVDFEDRPTRTISGVIRWSDDGRYAYSLIGNEVLRCSPGFIFRGGNCSKSLNGKFAEVVLTSVPTLYGEMYAATRITLGADVVFSTTSAALRRTWVSILLFHSNAALALALVLLNAVWKILLLRRK
jgi:hypothetical protein